MEPSLNVAVLAKAADEIDFVIAGGWLPAELHRRLARIAAEVRGSLEEVVQAEGRGRDAPGPPEPGP